jgi:hypothetical protein
LSYCFNAYQYWPGWIDGDGSAMIWEAHYGWFESYLPVVMTMIVRIIFFASIPDIFPVLLFQLLLGYSVLFIVFRWTGLSLPTALFSASLIMVFPPVSAYSGTLVKDVWFAWMAILATAALAKASISRNWLYWIIWVLAASLAVSFRLDGFGWLITVVVCSLYLFSRKRMFKVASLVLGSVFFVVGIWASLPILIEKFVPVEERYSSQQILLFDLAAISHSQQTLLIPAVFNPNGHDLDFLEENFNATSNMPILDWGQKGRGFRLVHEEAAQKDLRRSWTSAVLKFPGDYFSHRLTVAKAFLFGVPDPVGWFWYRHKTTANLFSAEATATPFRTFWQRNFLETFEETLLNQLWPYLLVSLLCTAVLIYRRDSNRNFALLLTAGSIVYSVGFAAIAPNVGFRYFSLAVYSSLIMLLLVGLHTIKVACHAKVPEERRAG